MTGPSGVPTITFEIMFKNKPCSTTPTVWSSSLARACASLDHLEIQVNNEVALVGYKSLIFRKTESRMVAFCSKWRKRFSAPYCTTSTGSLKAPRVATCLDSSTIQMQSLELVATIFSMRRAPPPPLIPFNWGIHFICAIHCHIDHFDIVDSLERDA